MVRPGARREVAGHLQVAYGISERRACRATGFGRSSQRYRKRSEPQVSLRMRLKELAAARVRYGYRRLHILLRREGWKVSHKPTPSQIRKSVTPDALISFVDGKPYKTLKRHLNGVGMTIEQYRERYSLPRDYPSTAASYSEARSKLAHSFGLGQKRKNAAPKAAEPADRLREAQACRPAAEGQGGLRRG